MNIHAITIHARIDGKAFKRFGLFDTFILKKRWRSPALFALILSSFALICFLLGGKNQASMLGTLLLTIGLLLPAGYLLSFYLQLCAQVKRLGLQSPRAVYTLVFTETGVRIMNDMRKEPELSLPYHEFHGAWRNAKAVYLYASPSKAFILPAGQASVSDAELWQFLCSCLPKGKVH